MGCELVQALNFAINFAKHCTSRISGRMFSRVSGPDVVPSTVNGATRG